jgi:hypothetical protein
VYPVTRHVSKRAAAGLAVVALAVAAPAAWAASSSTKDVVHAQIMKSGVVMVSGYDGGAPLAPGR